MTFKAEIPYGNYWSTPFAKWQGSLAGLHSLKFGAHVASQELDKREFPIEKIDYAVLGATTPQIHSFYGLPWVMGMLGAGHVGGPTLGQACATSVRCMLAAVQEIETGLATCALTITCDRTSNGPHIFYPAPDGIGGTGDSENFILDNMMTDPLGNHSMIKTAENVVARYQLTTEQQHELVLRREEQYQSALADERAFQKRYMTLPFDVPSHDFRKTAGTLDGDEGVTESTPAGLAKLKPVLEGGTVTFGGQTHPADGNAGMIFTTPETAAELSTEPKIAVRILGFGLARAELAYMPEAPVPAAQAALEQGGKTIEQVDAIKTHNPFVANDLVFAKAIGADVMNMNNYGCSLVWGHPNAPTGLRSAIELIEELAVRGGGVGLFTGCAAGDTAMAVLLEVGDR
jgi:acetyl-CoA acetyltransferase|tara:strand:- start:950 stop:2155 length:1206 start_codon:yes stop_codon:yes gene_type:complete